MCWKRFTVNKKERALVVKEGRRPAILTPGRYRISSQHSGSLTIEKHRLDNLVFQSVWADYLVRRHPDLADSHFHRVETNETQVGLVYVNGGLYTVLTPSKRLLFWRGVVAVTAEFIGVIGAPQVQAN